MNIASYALKRLGGLLLVLFVTSFLVFGLLYLAPGNPLSFILGPRGGTPEQIAAVTEKYHLNQPFIVRYFSWLGDLLHGDFGQSIVYRQNVSDMIGGRIGTTALLVTISAVLIAVTGVTLGTVAALRGGTTGTVISTLASIALSTPVFVIGALAYRLLTNVQPFYALSLIDRWRAPAVQTPQPIRAIDPEIPSAVADVVERMLHKQPHRRYLKVSELLTDLTLAISSMQSASTIETSPQRFLLNIGQVKNYAENGFLSALRPHGVVIDIRAGSRVREFVDAAHDVGAEAIVDPVTHYVRSPLAVRPAGFRKLPYGSAPVLTGFSDETSRREFCTNVLDSVTADEPDAIVSPYFYAAENEQSWLTESVACAGLTEALLTQRGQVTSMWLGVAVHSSWLANERQRDLLLTALTARQWRGVHLLLSTTQAPFGPLGDVDTLRGLRDLIAVLREAGTPVIVGRRASSGLLLLALGAEGWSTGVSGNLMNMTPHPEDETSGGRSLDRIYIPGLVNLVSIEAYLLMRARRPEYVELGTPQAAALLDGNPSLDDLSTEERILLLQHNLIAQSRQVSELATLPAGQRIARLRTWVDVATERYRELPPTRLPSEGPAFLEGWAEVLA